MRLLGWLLVALLLGLVAAPVLLTVAAIEDHPVVAEGVPLDARQARRAKSLVERTAARILRAKGLTEIVFSEEELNSLFALAGRGARGLAGRADVGEHGLEVAASVRLPRNPLGRYLNVRAGLEPSRAGLRVSRVTIGRIGLSGDFSLLVLRLGLDALLGEEQGSALVDSVRTVETTPGRLAIGLAADANIREGVTGLRERLVYLRDELALLGDPKVVAVYYRRIMELSGERPPGVVSLAWYLGPLFELARERSAGSDAAAENRALLLAVAMYFGHWRFESFVGDVRDAAMRAHRRRDEGVRLGGRKDLRLHFVISAGLEIVSDSGISDAIGEIKELLDSGEGGSGFSFVDLAADRAGVRFAEAATDARSAGRVQRLLAGRADEAAFFPDTAGLEEGMIDGAFERRYVGLDSPAYLAVVSDVDRRIAALPVHRAR